MKNTHITIQKSLFILLLLFFSSVAKAKTCLELLGDLNLYYLFNVTQLTVPEMAEQLSRAYSMDIPEWMIRVQLRMHGISIKNEFSQPISSYAFGKLTNYLSQKTLSVAHLGISPNAPVILVAEKLYSEGFPIKEIARTLGLGENALIYVFNALGVRPRRVTWNRALLFEGTLRSEEEILEILVGRKFKPIQIAQEINRLAGTPMASHPDYRTEIAIYKKVRRLEIEYPSPSPSTREAAVDKYLDWFLDKGRPPRGDEWGTGEGQIGFSDGRLYGHGVYASQKESAHLAYFSSYHEALLAIALRAEERGISSFRLLDLDPGEAPPSGKLFARTQIEALDRFLIWNSVNDFPETKDWGKGPNKVGISQGRLFGSQRYGEERKDRALFSSQQAALLAAKARSLHTKMAFDLLDVPLWETTPSLQIRLEFQRESLDRMIPWILKNKKLPHAESDWKEIAIDRGRVYGQYNFREGAGAFARRAFDSKEQALQDLYVEWIRRGLDIDLITDLLHKEGIKLGF